MSYITRWFSSFFDYQTVRGLYLYYYDYFEFNELCDFHLQKAIIQIILIALLSIIVKKTKKV